MKKNAFYVFILIVSLTSNLGFSQLFPVNKGEMYGYINNAGKLYAPYSYVSAADFSDSLGLVSKYDKSENQKYGYVNKFGQEVIPLIYDEAFSFHNGYALVSENDKSCIIDKKSKKYLVDNLFLAKRNFVSEGFIGIAINGKKGYADLNNKVIFPAEFDVITPFSEGFAIAIKDKKIVILDKTGKQFPTEYLDAFKFVNGVMAVKNAAGKWGMINNKLEVVLPIKYPFIDEFNNGLAPFQDENQKWGMMNQKGEIVIPAKYADISALTEGRILALNDDNSISLLDESFKEIKKIDPMVQFSPSVKFSFGLCALDIMVKDPQNKSENIRNYGGYATLFINKNGDKIFQGETYYACFPENSLVHMADFLSKKIQEIENGDEVLTFNQQTQTFEKTEVLELQVHTGSFELIELSVSQTSILTASLSENLLGKVEKLSATPNHPILTKNGVKQMGEIDENDILFVWNESRQSFDELQVLSTKKMGTTQKVYNLRTKGENYLINSVVVMRK